jgi:hypothetical protein
MQHLLCQFSTVVLILGSTKIVLRKSVVFWGTASCSLVDGTYSLNYMASSQKTAIFNHCCENLKSQYKVYESMSYFQHLERLRKSLILLYKNKEKV